MTWCCRSTFSLLPGSDRLYASTRVINPDPEEKPLYYWTNIAVPESPGTRVLTTADAAWRTEYTGALIRVPVPSRIARTSTSATR